LADQAIDHSELGVFEFDELHSDASAQIAEAGLSRPNHAPGGRDDSAVAGRDLDVDQLAYDSASVAMKSPPLPRS